MAWEKRRLIVYGVAAASTLAAAASFSIWQLSRILFSVVRESDYEASKLIASVTACINSDSPDEEQPEELELINDVEGVYAYGTLQELYFRHHVRGNTDWEWSFDQVEWFPTDNLAPNHSFMLDPPSIIFITRLHIMSVIRRKRADAADAAPVNSSASSTTALGRQGLKAAPRIPPPVALPQWAAQQVQQLQHQQHLKQAPTTWPAQQLQRQCSRCSGADRRIDDAPDVLCCPITGQIMLQPVSLPSGKTFEHEAVRKWITQHGTDPTTLTPVSINDLHPNLLIRDMVERWLAGRDPLFDDNQE